VEQRKQQEETKRKAEAQRKQREDARRKAEDKRMQAEAQARREQMAQEQALLDAQSARLLDRHLAEYTRQIQAKVAHSWLRPLGAPKGLKCTVKVAQIPGGEVVRVIIIEGSGNVAFDRSVETAVLGSSPLPQPKDPSLFAREIIFEFEPED
jgi:colicin import membrane protein